MSSYGRGDHGTSTWSKPSTSPSRGHPSNHSIRRLHEPIIQSNSTEYQNIPRGLPTHGRFCLISAYPGVRRVRTDSRLRTSSSIAVVRPSDLISTRYSEIFDHGDDSGETNPRAPRKTGGATIRGGMDTNLEVLAGVVRDKDSEDGEVYTSWLRRKLA
ncbi:hypothetical protein JAAARDRAFT_594090 [Jaapia argillacea MUCL 33604]|uniref:Biotin carboxylation domain-containing protein n=1 Tax=Jaapia argillacea MUCL 33604 TaxID=933084 RepID=A0A067Q953_9AGAM|nr:hypothetical protein JAAARDRAFT_594090 [Jaapia argillacea MUCL 33604]